MHKKHQICDVGEIFRLLAYKSKNVTEQIINGLILYLTLSVLLLVHAKKVVYLQI